MTTEPHDDSLTAAERAALARWADADPPEDFVDRVMEAWEDDVEAARAIGARPTGPGTHRATMIAIASAVLAAAAVVAIWMGAHARASAIDPVEEGGVKVAELRADARAVLARNCTPCHDGAAPEAEAGALRVFDVSSDAWWSRPSDEALLVMNDRLAAHDDASEVERAKVAAFVDDELYRRADAG